MGVTLFREAAPASFGNFVRGLSVMFRLTAGDTWVDGLDEFDENGGPNYDASFFVYSYIVIVVWILLQVSVAVLLVSSPTHPLLSGGAPEAGSTWAAYLVVSSSRYPPQGPLFRGGERYREGRYPPANRRVRPGVIFLCLDERERCQERAREG